MVGLIEEGRSPDCGMEVTLPLAVITSEYFWFKVVGRTLACAKNEKNVGEGWVSYGV